MPGSTGLSPSSTASPALSAAAAALVLATALRIAEPLTERPVAAAIGALTFLAITVAHVRMPLVIAALAPVSIVSAWQIEPRLARGR